LALYDIYGPHDHGHVHGHVHVHVHVHDHDHSILSIRVDRFNPAKTSESSNSRPKGFSVARGQGDPWSIEYIGSLEVAKRLVQAGLDSADPKQSEGSPIQIALHLRKDPFPLQNLPEVDTIRSKAHGSILNTAAFCHNEEVVAELLKRVPETDVQEYVNLYCDLGTPLYCAASLGSISMLEQLLEKGAQVNLVGGQLGSPLMAACAIGQVEAVTLLLRNGAELERVQPDGTLVKAEEAARQHETVLSILRQFKEKGVEALGEAAPVKTADISKLDEFMVGFKERKEKGLGASTVRPSLPRPRARGRNNKSRIFRIA
jgi:hypothetical protein